MDQKLFEKLPAYLQLKSEVKRYIAERNLKQHDLLPSEAQLASQYHFSIGTVRKALNELAVENIIYRRHGRGTFVSPRGRKGKILIVPANNEMQISRKDDYFDFLMGALNETVYANLSCEPAIVKLDDFMSNVDSIKMIYPELAGVIFFRSHNNITMAIKELQRQKVPCLFYGANIYDDTGNNYSTVCYDEYKIASILAQLYAECGFKRVFIFRGRSYISDRRVELLSEQCAKFGIETQSMRWAGYGVGNHDELAKLAREYDVFSCVYSIIAIEVVQTLERILGLKVPDNVAVAGVDDFPANERLHPNLTVVDLCNASNGGLCLRRFSEALERDNFSNFHLFGSIRLVRRESC